MHEDKRSVSSQKQMFTVLVLDLRWCRFGQQKTQIRTQKERKQYKTGGDAVLCVCLLDLFLLGWKDTADGKDRFDLIDFDKTESQIH
jgi:hypothetical protein